MPMLYRQCQRQLPQNMIPLVFVRIDTGGSYHYSQILTLVAINVMRDHDEILSGWHKTELFM